MPEDCSFQMPSVSRQIPLLEVPDSAGNSLLKRIKNTEATQDHLDGQEHLAAPSTTIEFLLHLTNPQFNFAPIPANPST